MTRSYPRLSQIAFVVVAATLSGCASQPSFDQGQAIFQSPERAAQALATAARTDDVLRLREIFGPHGEEVLASGDRVADGNSREVFAVAMEQGWTIDRVDSATRELIVGHEAWPFPIPLVRDSRGWRFDTEAGKFEILARRIGRNELAAIGVLRTYVLAQEEYARVGHDGSVPGIFAQQVRSDPGRHNGLYWPVVSPTDQPSPLGEFAAEAAKEGYTGDAEAGSRPYHGYYYRILKGQGSSAPGGALNYIVDGEMTEGFAMIAYPAEYMNSGVMTFIVGPDGVVYEADLGQDTLTIASTISTYDPDTSWRVVE